MAWYAMPTGDGRTIPLEMVQVWHRLADDYAASATSSLSPAETEQPLMQQLQQIQPIMRGEVMKIVVIGGTGLIGSKVVGKLKQKGHEAIGAGPNTGVNTIPGEGRKEAMAGNWGGVDLPNSPSFEDKPAAFGRRWA